MRLSTEIETIKNGPKRVTLELKNIITEVKISLEVSSSRRKNQGTQRQVTGNY